MNFEKELQNILEEIGLTSIQCRYYIYVLKTGGTSISNIAKNLNINRANSYIILEKLKRLDLVWEENKSVGKVVYAKSYKSLSNNLEKKKNVLSHHEKKLKDFEPIFNSFTLSPNVERPRIRTYDGLDGLEEIIRDIIDLSLHSSEILLFTNQEDERYIFSKIKHQDFIKRRIEKNIKIRVLAVNNKEGFSLITNEKKYLRQTKILENNFLFNCEIYIYDNKICMIDLKQDIIGIIIESSELYKIHKHLFEVQWANLK